MAAVLVYAGSMSADFVLDDVEIVRDNPRLESPAALPQLWTTDYWAHVPAGDHGLYRPLALTTFAVQRWLGADAAAPYKVVNVVLHAAVSALLFAVVLRLGRDATTALLAGLLFAVHPVHTEAVAGIVGRSEMLALLFTLLAVESIRRAFAAPRFSPGFAIASVACVFAAAASKEWGIVAPAVVLWTQLLFRDRGQSAPGTRRTIAVFAGYAAVVALYLMLRAGAVGPRGVHEVFEGAGTGPRVLTSLRVVRENVALLLAPIRLVADYEAIGTPLSRRLSEPRVLASPPVLAVIPALIVLAFRRRPVVAWGLGVFLGTLLPVSNLLFAVGVVRAERVLYAPSAGFLAACAAGLAYVLARPGWKRLGVGLAAAAVLLGAGRTVARVRDWKDNCTLARVTLEDAPESAVFGAIRARCLLDENRHGEARAAAERVLARRPDFVPALIVSGVLDRVEGREAQAIETFERVLAVEGEHRVALSNAAWLHLRAGRFSRASELYDRWSRLDPHDPEPAAGLIAALAQGGDLEAASRAAAEGARRFPRDANVLRNAEIVRRLASTPAAP